MHTLALFTLFVLLTGYSHAAIDCPAASTPLQHQFESGAAWELCWRADPQLGLVASQLAYTSPESVRRQVLEEIHLAGLLLHYDDASSAIDIVSEYGLGPPASLELQPAQCAGELLSGDGGQTLLCKRYFYRNTLTRYANADTLQRHAMRLSMHAKVGAQVWSTSIELTEDGMILPSSALSGRINRFTDNPEAGTDIGHDVNPQVDAAAYATNATLLSIWRLDFNIDGTPGNDSVDEIQFDSDMSTGVRRRIAIEAINTETRRQTAPLRFRGWRIRDRDLSAATDGGNLTRVGYYLDPQDAGYVYNSNRLNWARHQFFVTDNNACERLAVNNQRVFPECGNSLDDFVSTDPATGQSAPVTDPVAWYAMARRFTPHAGDWPAINTRQSTFRLIPFDWSAQSPFSADNTVGTP